MVEVADGLGLIPSWFMPSLAIRGHPTRTRIHLMVMVMVMVMAVAMVKVKVMGTTIDNEPLPSTVTQSRDPARLSNILLLPRFGLVPLLFIGLGSVYLVLFASFSRYASAHDFVDFLGYYDVHNTTWLDTIRYDFYMIWFFTIRYSGSVSFLPHIHISISPLFQYNPPIRLPSMRPDTTLPHTIHCTHQPQLHPLINIPSSRVLIRTPIRQYKR